MSRSYSGSGTVSLDPDPLESCTPARRKCKLAEQETCNRWAEAILGVQGKTGRGLDSYIPQVYPPIIANLGDRKLLPSDYSVGILRVAIPFHLS